MNSIKRVSIIGLGSLGILYASQLLNVLPHDKLRVVADEDRIKRYKKDGIYCNGKVCDFNYIAPTKEVEPADLMIFAVKHHQLDQAIKDAKNHVGENTIIISVLNGIESEAIIGENHCI